MNYIHVNLFLLAFLIGLIVGSILYRWRSAGAPDERLADAGAEAHLLRTALAAAEAEVVTLRAMHAAACDRIVGQSELLSRRAAR